MKNRIRKKRKKMKSGQLSDTIENINRCMKFLQTEGERCTMSKRRKKTGKKPRVLWKLLLFALVALLFVGIMLLRYRKALELETEPAGQTITVSQISGPEEIPQPAPQAEEKQIEEQYTEEKSPVPTATGTFQPSETVQMPSVESGTEQVPARKAIYNEQTYQLVTDMVYTRRHLGSAGEETISTLLDDLKAADPDLGNLWAGIMDYWGYVSDGLTIYPDTLPDGLPEDNSLCIAVLGFQLMYDGEMTPELIGRCETALTCVKKYPNAYLLVTGGGTAYGNRTATEADVMAEWFLEKGVAAEQIIIENRSLTTDQNATYSCRILAESYPEIKNIAVVSSDYHVALGSMLFTEAALIYAYEHRCSEPYQVISNAGFRTAGNETYSNPANFGSDIWVMADPTY